MWVGKEANEAEKKEALATAQEYLQTHPSGREVDTPILVIKQGFEPPNFTGWFLAWDPNKWSVSESYRIPKNILHFLKLWGLLHQPWSI